MKKQIITFLSVILIITITGATGCGKTDTPTVVAKPQVSQMKSIFELAVMECYYHNVAKYNEEDASGVLWWKKDKHFWIEYSGVVKLGIDVSLVHIDINDSTITITLPEAKVLGCKVDSASLTKDSYIVDKNSATITATDEIMAFNEAQQKLEEEASSNKALLSEAQQRAKTLLENYITNIGTTIGETYTITWVYEDGNTNETTQTSQSPVE